MKSTKLNQLSSQLSAVTKTAKLFPTATCRKTTPSPGPAGRRRSQRGQRREDKWLRRSRNIPACGWIIPRHCMPQLCCTVDHICTINSTISTQFNQMQPNSTKLNPIQPNKPYKQIQPTQFTSFQPFLPNQTHITFPIISTNLAISTIQSFHTFKLIQLIEPIQSSQPLQPFQPI